jgi:gas vesicle protein
MIKKGIVFRKKKDSNSLNKIAMKSVKVILGILAGIAGGTLLGLLFAPEKGSATRKRIYNKGEDYAEGLKLKLEGVLDAVADKYDATWNEVQVMASDGKAKMKSIKDEVNV